MKKSFLFPLAISVVSGCSTPEEKLVKIADRIHASILTVDTHCNTPSAFAEPGFDLGIRNDELCVDFPKMKEGGLHSEFFAVLVEQGPRNDTAFNEAHEVARSFIKALHENVKKNSKTAEIALTSNDAYRLKKEGKIAVFIGLENGYPLGKNTARIREYYDLGVRCLTLSHTANNDICDSSTDPKGPEYGGLSPFGEQVISEMNRVGMLVDVSHISDDSFYDVLKISKAPVIASHSSCRALCGSPRNLTDDMLLALRENGGVIQISIMSAYLKTPDPNPELNNRLKELRLKYGDYEALPEDSKRMMRKEFRAVQRKYEKLASVKDVADHIDHAVQVIGIDHVGIGTDFDGGGGVEGCRNVSEMKNITIELLHRGYTRKDIRKIWSGNIMRVMRKAEDISEVV